MAGQAATRQEAGISPLKVFGRMLAFYRGRAGLTSDELGGLVRLSGSQIRKIEAGSRVATWQLVNACEQHPGMRCDGAFRELFEAMGEYLKTGAFKGWF